MCPDWAFWKVLATYSLTKVAKKFATLFGLLLKEKTVPRSFFGLFCTLFDYCLSSIWSSVTRLGDLLDFGQLYKAFGNN